MSRWASAIVALLLVSAVGTSSLALCVEAPAAAPPAQMACCQNGHEQCPMHRSRATSAAECCRRDTQHHQELTAAEQQRTHLRVTFHPIAVITWKMVVPTVLEQVISALNVGGSDRQPTPRTALPTVLLI